MKKRKTKTKAKTKTELKIDITIPPALFVLCLNDFPIGVYGSLEDAKEHGENHKAKMEALQQIMFSMKLNYQIHRRLLNAPPQP